MSGVWVFKNGVVRLDNDRATVDYSLVHVPTGEVISSYASLTQILLELGWKPYDNGNSELLQFAKDSGFISLPKNFNKFKGVSKAMVVTNNPGVFKLVQETNEQKETTAAAEDSS
ncbi:hypothetical protein DCAR_0104963 [Daucus carota subsp. sativus]|uniref:Uncharacterized protein n=1 Tax=Daucus carota subsp. sativus TaxID=79200 RepID=A0A166J979_DAUCS|nr:PREDICTED: flowering-promoting factor 1-like [Daucus carota subsp. sativus]WOG85770.1 hypothetical protein DCAR_0104963 [Daucus carota subsp. sativus]